MSLKSIIITIVSVVLIAAAGISCYIFWPAIKGTITGASYYTAKDLQESYDKGFNDGNESKIEMQSRLDYYSELVDKYSVEVVDLTKQVNKLTKDNATYTSQIETLSALKIEHEQIIQNLTSTNEQNNEKIKKLQKQVSDLQDELEQAENDGSLKDEDIVAKNKQIESLQTTIAQLQNVNEINLATITTLSGQIATLNSQINDLQFQINNNSDITSKLNDRIVELEKSVKYYEDYVKTLENDETVIVTFEFNGSVINVQVIKKGSKVSIVNPESTEYVIFNYWTIDGEQVDLNNYQVEKSVKIVANVTYKYTVKFDVDGVTKQTTIVEKDMYASAPAVSKDGYEFDGWTINGKDIVDVESYKITRDTTFTAKFTKLHTVTFMYESETKSTQKVRDGEYAISVHVDSTTYKVFKGWKVNDAIVDVNSYKIIADTIFTADITYKYDVKFTVDSQQHGETQIIESGHFSTLPVTPSKDRFVFEGWTLNGYDVVDVANYKITNNTTFIAKFREKVLNDYTWTEIKEISDSGRAQEYFKVGDEKDITITYAPDDVEIVTVVIADFDVDNLSGGKGKAHISFVLKELISKTYKLHDFYQYHAPEHTGFYESVYYTEIYPKIFNGLDADLQSVIQDVSTNFNWGPTYYDVKLWLLSDNYKSTYSYYNDHEFGDRLSNGLGENVAVAFGTQDHAMADAQYYYLNGHVYWTEDNYLPAETPIGLKFGFCV